jgi:hypothetical protein
MLTEDLERKLEAFALAGKSNVVRFNHQMEEDRLHITGITWDGFITLREYPGEFAPHLFVPLSDQNP